MAVEREAASNICVFGVGGVGGYFGGKLAWFLANQSDPEWRIHLIARGPHLAEIDRAGLTLSTPEARLTCSPASAADSMEGLPVPDVVLLCVKSYDLDDVVRQIAGHCHEGTVVIPLLNGVDIHARIRAQLSCGVVLPACALVGSHLERPGVVSQQGADGFISMGADPDHAGFIPESFLALLKLAGVRHEWFDDARPALWNKYLFISAYGLVTAASGATLGEVSGDGRLMDDVRGIMNEVAEIARGEGVPLGPNAIADALAKASGFPAGTKTSLQRDVEAGRRDEGDLFGGTIMRLGREHGIPTPFTERVYAQVRGA